MTVVAPGDAGSEDARDVLAPMPFTRTEGGYQGAVINVVNDLVDLGPAGTVRREMVEHLAAVAIVALDNEERVALVDQYRHPVRSVLWEIPAGMLDIPGEDALAAAKRELWEEADLRAGRWDVLADFFSSPGFTDEVQRIFLARDLDVVPPAERHVREHEEAAMTVRWVPLDTVVARVLDGSLHDSSVVVGALAAHAARASGWATLRPTDAPWPYRPGDARH
jgi:ADP-ribose pyrophosphatase